jgi:hypothetical protein
LPRTNPNTKYRGRWLGKAILLSSLIVAAVPIKSTQAENRNEYVLLFGKDAPVCQSLLTLYNSLLHSKRKAFSVALGRIAVSYDWEDDFVDSFKSAGFVSPTPIARDEYGFAKPRYPVIHPQAQALYSVELANHEKS